eukprot:2701790-Rhodomonas_salina.1
MHSSTACSPPFATRCAVLAQRTMLRPCQGQRIMLRPCYALCGTDGAYAVVMRYAGEWKRVVRRL